MSNGATATFAYQGFGFGEFHQAQSKLKQIFDQTFQGVFEAPSPFLELSRTLESLADNLERLFDENANPHSEILRAENKPHAQQILRIASHGLIDTLRLLERSIPREVAMMVEDPKMKAYNIVMHLTLGGEDQVLEMLNEKFRFQVWKLEILFRVLRRSKIERTLKVYDAVQHRLGSLLEELTVKKSTASNETMSSAGLSEASGMLDVDVLQRFQDACEFGSGQQRFVWKLQPESTMLITLHWVFHLSQHNDPKNHPVESYVNLMKCSWLLRVSTPEAGVEGFSDEMRTMIALLGFDVIFQLQQYFDLDVDPPVPSELVDRGDFTIFIDGVNSKDLGTGLTRTAAPTAFPCAGPSQHHQPSKQQPHQMSLTMEHYLLSGPPSKQPEIANGTSFLDEGSARSSMDLEMQWLSSSTPQIPPATILPQHSISSLAPSVLSAASRDNGLRPGHSPGSSMGSIARIHLPGLPENVPVTSHIGSRPSTIASEHMMPGMIDGGGNNGNGSTVNGNGNTTKPAVKKTKPSYSWNEVVDRENLGVRPGEVEILCKDFEIMQMMASYTGDRHGRWDNCRLRIFKLMEDKTLRILTLMEGNEQCIDQRVAYVKEAELVPAYGYVQNHPVIYIRKTHRQDPFLSRNPGKAIQAKPMPPSSLYYKFRNAHDMFNFQFALLGEAVETDFQAVRTIRYKKSLRDGEHSHYKARIQLWREQDDEDVLASTPTIVPPAHTAAWGPSQLKIHTTRVVMFWDETITTFFITDSIDIEHRNRRFVVRIRPSSYKSFSISNPSTVKARTFGSREQPGGFRLDKKGLFPEDEPGFDDYKWFEVEFNNQEEMDNFYQEFKKAVNIRRKERWQAEELRRLAARGVTAGQEVHVVTPITPVVRGR